MSSGGWYRVAVGMQLVAQAAAEQGTKELGTTAARALQHGLDVSRTAAVAAAPIVQEGLLTINRLSKAAASASGAASNEASESIHTRTSQNGNASSQRFQVQKEDISRQLSTVESIPTTSALSGSLVSADASSIRPQNQSSTSPPPAASLDPYRTLKEGSAVPTSRIGRAVGFASLGMGLALGTAVEGVSRVLGGKAVPSSSSLVANDANSDRLAASLCRMRGAALKMGQMLSIQDEALLPPPLVSALAKVRQGAEAMPKHQLFRQLQEQLGNNWRQRFVDFDERPFAAASIGQVHRASITVQSSDYTSRSIVPVVVKVQFPGVASSIASDLRNLSMLVSWTGMAPKGLFLDNVIRVGEAELTVECDYHRELQNQQRMKALVESDPVLKENRFVVPTVYPEWSSQQVLTSAFCPGGTIEKVLHLDQTERNRIGRAVLYLTIQELFCWRTMQTDPQWANYLYDIGTQTTSLIDFGATREYSKEFVDGYLRIVWASANRDEEALMEQSFRMGFLTGQESPEMLHAHKWSGFTVGEPFWSNEGFDFQASNISSRMSAHTSVFLRQRLTPPPEEVYTLHRKLAGAYMLCIKIGAVVKCREILEEVVLRHEFDDGLSPLTTMAQ